MKYPVAISLLILLLSAFSAHGQESAVELEWDTLIPEDYRPDKIMNQYGNLDELEDDDPRAQEILRQLEEAWNAAPVVASLDGRRVRLPGFVVPIEGDGRKLSEFLLVPYYGACIHVPPPPANQTVYVSVPAADAEIRNAFDTVWVTGILSAKPFNTDLANAGYQLRAEQVTPYE